MKTVVFLGAGASKAMGFPLTSEILPRILEGIRTGELFGGGAANGGQRASLDELLRTMLPGSGKVDEKHLPLITDVLSILDFSLLSSSSPLPRQRRQQLSESRKLLERAILEIIDCPYDHLTVPARLRRFADWLHRRNGHVPDDVSVISSNYDISVETELFGRIAADPVEKLVDFGVEWRDPGTGRLHPRPAEPRFRIYKLHGSVNWLRCPLCDHVYVNVYGSITHNAFAPDRNDFNTCECDYWPLEPVVVAPSTVRDIRDSSLLEIWRHSLEVLRSAERWVIVGYSFPPEDIAIRSMFLRAYAGRRKAPSVEVVQVARDPAVEARYRVFFPDCVYGTGGMEGFVDALALD
ncbi:MAG TPA: hypothetical protein VF263_12960 [Longimicrobiaceae bacterium]